MVSGSTVDQVDEISDLLRFDDFFLNNNLICYGHPDYEIPDITFNFWYRCEGAFLFMISFIFVYWLGWAGQFEAFLAKSWRL